MNTINTSINDPGIAIICNAWEELKTDIHLKSFQITLDCIDNNPNIQSILLAATHVNLNQYNQGPNAWFDHSKQIFVDEQGVDWLRQYWNKAQSNNTSSFHHSAIIRDHNYQGKPCIAIWEQWQLEWLINHYFTNIKNVWYFGAGLGVRRDPFGWGQLCDLIRYNHVRPLNILTHRQGMLNNRMDSDHVQKCNFEYIEWENITDWEFITKDVLVKTTLDWQY